MANILTKYKLPTTRANGRALAVDEISGVEISLSTDGATYSPINTVAPPTQELLITELEPGTWYLRYVVIDKRGNRGVPHSQSVVIEDNSPPSAVTEVTIEFV